MKNLKGNTATPEQRTEFDAWVNRKPKSPTTLRPIRKQALMPFGIGIPLTFMGVLIGVIFMVIGVTFLGINAIVAFLLLLAIAFFMGIILPVGTVLIVDEIYDKRYRREMHDAGWTAFEDALDGWRQEGSEKFTTLAEQDYLTSVRLKLHLDFD
jgi:hypothetical protein